MTKEQKKTLESKLAELDNHERHKLYKRAAQLRKLAQRKNKTVNRANYREFDNDEPLEVRRPKPELHDWVLRLLEEETVADVLPSLTGDLGTVIAIGPRSAEVILDGEVVTALLSKELAANQQADLAVGDLVEVARRGRDAAVIESVRPRRTKLSRPDPGPKPQERVIVVNVDVIVVVFSLVSPPLHPRLIDRYLVAIQRGGALPVIAVNKVDLVDRASLADNLKPLKPYEALGVAVARCSASDRTGLQELRGLITGKVSAFVGHSGVGKSSLLNALKPDLNLEVSAVSEGYGRGRHTTTRSTMWDLGGDTRVIDTPGVRSFGLWKLTAEELPWYFPEFASAGNCKFRDCSHTHEPKCAVKTAVEAGDVSRDRYDTYLRLLDSMG